METKFLPPGKKILKTTLGCTKMKKGIVILFQILSITLSAQSYTVIHTIGEIYDVKSARYLAKGMKISDEAELRFDTPNARAAVLSSSRGRYIIQLNSQNNSQSDLAYTLASIISPVRGQLSTRAGGINNALDFTKHFEEEPIAMVGESYSLRVSPSAYPMNQEKFFYVQYEYEGEFINKKLTSEGDELIFDSSVYSIDDQPIDSEQVKGLTLFYYNANEQESLQLAALQLVPISFDILKSIASNFEDPLSEQSVQSMAELITDLYGKCNMEALRNTLESIYGN